MSNLLGHTIVSARTGLRTRQFTSQELTRAYLDQIHKHNARLNAYITVDDEYAMQMARAADERIARGDDTPLLGVPIAVKDVLCTRDMRTTAGSRILENYVPMWDATSVKRLRDAGAVFLGKTNTDEFAMGSSTENSAYGVTHNPHDETRIPGGTSGGSAAAVAADLCVAALGTDTGGSVRQPASMCGVVGLKNTYGRVSRYGLIACASSLDSVGVLTKNVADAATVLNVMGGHDALDSTSLDSAPVDLNVITRDAVASLKGLRVGVPKEFFIDGMQPEVAQHVRAAIGELERAGAHIVEINLPNTPLSVPVYYIILPAEASANLSRFEGVRFGARVPSDDLIEMYQNTRGAGFGAEVKRRIMLGTYALSAGYYDAYYIRAQKVRTLIKRDFEQAFEKVDVIAAPVAPSTAFKIGEKISDPIQMYLEDVFTLPLSLAGMCGISVPCGFDSNKLPIGLQLMGPMLGEQTILRAAQAFEQLHSKN